MPPKRDPAYVAVMTVTWGLYALRLGALVWVLAKIAVLAA